MSNILRIGNGQGFWGDSIDAPVRLAKDGPLDYLTLDYLAEVTLSIMQRQKLKNPNTGYARDFLILVENIEYEVVYKTGGSSQNSKIARIRARLSNFGRKHRIRSSRSAISHDTLRDGRKGDPQHKCCGKIENPSTPLAG